MRKIISIIISGLLLLSCEKDETIIKPGKFELQLISSQPANLQESFGQDASEIFLDTIKSSRSFNFTISNSGQYDITDVTITADNENFIVSHTSIPLIQGTDSEKVLNQVISIDVLHGTMIHGYGFNDFLDKGDNFCNLSIQGKSFNGDSIIAISLYAKIKVYAKIMSITVYQGRFIYDLSIPDRHLSGGDPFSIEEMDIFQYFTINPPVTIKNTGNVGIELTMASFDIDRSIIQTAVIPPNDTLNLLLTLGDADSTYGGKIRLDSEGTVFDFNKLNMGRDGAAYFSMMYPSAHWFRNNPIPQRIY